MSITDEMREWFISKRWFGWGFEHTIEQMLDCIDAEHKKALDEQFKALTVDMKPMTDENMAANGWIRLPVDADGEVWHVGDFAVGEVNPKNPKAIERMIWYGPDSGWQLETNTIIYPCPDRPRHYHAPTVEDVLHELVGKAQALSNVDDEEELVADFAKRLTLAGDAE